MPPLSSALNIARPSASPFITYYRTTSRRLLHQRMPHATATLQGKTVAEADKYETVEGNIYVRFFHLKTYQNIKSVDKSLFSDSKTKTVCGWKGTASYYNVTVDGKEVKDAAWYYPEPKDKAMNIKDHVAFYKNKVDIKSS